MILLLALLAIFNLFSPRQTFASSDHSPSSKGVLDDFSGQEVGHFPQAFSTYPFQYQKAKKVYSIQTEGNNLYLNGSTKDSGVKIFKKITWDLNQFPSLSWRWRANALPAGGAEDKPEANDSACSVYVIFGSFGGKAIKYVWSSSLPRETVLEGKPNSFYLVIAESGTKNLGKWQTVKVDVLKDYQRIFKSDPPNNPKGIGILTDGDQTLSLSSCDYDDFEISSSSLQK